MSQEANLHPQIQHIHTILLDMDGVITSESCYWDAARLTVLEVLGHPRYVSWDAVGFDLRAPLDTLLARSHRLLSNETIAQIKARAINTNWDVAYVMAGLYLIQVCSQLAPCDREQIESHLMDSDWNVSTLQALGYLWESGQNVPEGSEVWSAFADFLEDRRGFEAIESLNAYWRERTGRRSAPFRRNVAQTVSLPDGRAQTNSLPDGRAQTNSLPDGRAQTNSLRLHRGEGFWRFCQDRFQAWYLGREGEGRGGKGKEEEGGEGKGREGLIYQERPLLPVEKVRETLTGLRDLGLTLGVATGRPYQEIVTPLEQMNLLSLFDRDHFATHREVETAEAELRSVGIDAALSKPHPFLFLRALYPSLSAREIWEGHYPTEGHQEVAVVGDAVSDVVAAKAIGCYSISVLTGAGGSDQATALRDAGTDLILPDVTYLMRDA